MVQKPDHKEFEADMLATHSHIDMSWDPVQGIYRNTAVRYCLEMWTRSKIRAEIGKQAIYFQHKKTAKMYLHLGIVFQKSDNTPMVVYKSEDDGTVWVRSLTEFEEKFVQVEHSL